jgi:hypothetical protein
MWLMVLKHEAVEVVFSTDCDAPVCHVSWRGISFCVAVGFFFANRFEIEQIFDFSEVVDIN